MVAVKIHNPYRALLKGESPQRSAARTRTAAATQAPKQRTIARHTSKRDEELYDEGGQFNPRRATALPSREDVRRVVRAGAGNDRVFDKRGSLQATDRKDALTQIAHVLREAEGLAGGRPQDTSSVISMDEKRKVLAAALSDPSQEGFMMVGQELALPIKDMLDYEQWGRKRLRVRHLKQGEFFRITRDVRATAWVIGQDGQSLESVPRAKYVPLNPFKITAFCAVDIDDIWEANYDILDRIEDTARQEIGLEEDKRVVALMDAASTTTNTLTNFGTLGIGALEDMRRQVERHRLAVDCFAMHRDELSDIVKTMSTQVDPVTQREIILAGYAGSLLNAKLLISSGIGQQEVVPTGNVYAMAAPENCGEFAVQIELQAEQYNKLPMKETKKGWAFVEKIALAWINHRAISKGVKV